MSRDVIPNKVTIHCSATENGEFLDPSGRKTDAEVIADWHKKRGYRTIGYHLVISPDGSPSRGRGVNKIGAHVRRHNVGNIGICLIGTDRFNIEQFRTLRYYLQGYQLAFGIKPYNFWCHYEFDTAQQQGKTCPNMNVKDILYWYVSHDVKPIQKYLLE